ncbi:MAG: glycosyltransferase 87 family protein [Gemmataceae bacterium]
MPTVRFPGDNWPKGLRIALWTIVLVVVAVPVVVRALADPHFGLNLADEQPQLNRDFPAHFRFARAVVLEGLATRTAGEAGSVYTAAAHESVLQSWTGHANTPALPFAYSPTMLWLLLPLMPLPVPWAYAVWTAASLAAWVWAAQRAQLSLLPSLAALLSPLALWAVALGQTALLTLAGLVFLATSEPRSRRGVWSAGLVLWALTAKPPLAVTAAAALLASGQTGVVLRAGLLTLVSTVAAWPWLGPNWVSDYVYLVTHYTVDQADPAFAWILQPAYMSNLRATLVLYLGTADATAARVSTLAWAASLLALVGMAVWRRWEIGRVWATAVLAYLLLSPHVNSTEDLHLLLLGWPAVAVVPGWPAVSPAVPAAVVWLSPGNAPVQGWRWPLLVVIAKLAAGCRRAYLSIGRAGP